MKSMIVGCMDMFLIVTMLGLSLEYSFREQHLLDEENVSIYLRSDYFVVENKGFIHLWIDLDDVDEIHITENDIVCKGFDADINYFAVRASDYAEKSYYCSVSLSNIRNNVNINEKTIEIREGISTLSGKPNPMIIVHPEINFISIYTLLKIVVLIFLVCNVLFTGMDILSIMINSVGKKILFWFNALTVEYVTYKWFTDLLRLNPDTKVILLLIALLSAEFLYHLLLAKKVLGNFTYTLFIIFVSTCSIICLSNIFTSYYLTFKETYNTLSYKNIILPSLEINISSYRLRNIMQSLAYFEYSFRYFFSFPSDDCYGWVSILQFIIGKMYELIMFGGIANLILQWIRLKKRKKRYKEKDK